LKNIIKGVQHLGIPVIDMDKTIKWYTDMLNFETIYKAHIPVNNKENIKIAFIKLGNIVLEFYQLVGADFEEIKKRKSGHIDHFAIDVLDINKAFNEISKKCIELKSSAPDAIETVESIWDKGSKYFNIKSVNGETIEINERIGNLSLRNENIFNWAHLGIPVTNIYVSKEFYKNLGFAVVSETEIVGVVKLCMLENKGFIIELYQFLGDEIIEISKRKHGIIDHIAFSVNDIEKAFYELKKSQFNVENKDLAYMDIWENGTKFFNILGPDNERIEFNQIF
jgi:lactoylglutathione lyase